VKPCLLRKETRTIWKVAALDRPTREKDPSRASPASRFTVDQFPLRRPFLCTSNPIRGYSHGARVSSCGTSLLWVDSRNRVLLPPVCPTHGSEVLGNTWGGIGGCETFEEAAAREALEELGVRNPHRDALSDRTADFVLVDRQVHQTERFFLLRLESLKFDDEVEKCIAAGTGSVWLTPLESVGHHRRTRSQYRT